MQLSVEAVQNCRLSVPQHEPNSTRACDNGFSSGGFFSTKSGDLAQLLIAKTVVTLVSRPDQRFLDLQASGNPIPCWQPDLQQAVELYEGPGRWDVEDPCIDVLFGVARKVLKSSFNSALRQFNTALKPKSKSSKTWLLLEFLNTYAQASAAKFFKPKLHFRTSEFREVARERRSRTSARTTVSCRNLKERRSDIFSKFADADSPGAHVRNSTLQARHAHCYFRIHAGCDHSLCFAARSLVPYTYSLLWTEFI